MPSSVSAFALLSQKRLYPLVQIRIHTGAAWGVLLVLLLNLSRSLDFLLFSRFFFLSDLVIEEAKGDISFQCF